MQFSANQFTWTGNTGVAELSDLGRKPGDGIPAGFLVESSKTGKIKNFVFHKTLMSPGGDLLGARYFSGQFMIDLLND